jgi:hypothetical protein
MTTASRFDRAASIAGAVLRAVARVIVRTAVYLGPLLLEAAAYTWRLLVDAAHGARMLWLRRRTRKTPERAAEFDLTRGQLRDAKTARWAEWRAVPLRRRLAVQTAVVAILAAVVITARARYQTSEQSEIDTAATVASLEVPAADGAPSTPALVPIVDLEAAAARFERDARATAPGQWTFLTEGPVLAPGTRGEWDGFTVASPWVLKDVDRGATRYRMWYRGCYFRGRDRGCAIGHATSADGIRWQKTKGPVFEPADSGERRRLHGVTVARSGDRYFLWYSVTPELFGPRTPSTLHLATSPDGLRWEPAGQVLATTERGPHAMEPSALHDGRQFHLWFLDSLRTFEPNDYELQEGAPFLMHFTSADGRTWQESGRFSLKQSGFDYLRVVVEPRRDGGLQAIGFANSQLVRLVSSDGSDWQTDPGAATTIERRSLSADVWDVSDATALESESGTLTWFVTQRQRGHEEIRVGMRRAK